MNYNGRRAESYLCCWNGKECCYFFFPNQVTCYIKQITNRCQSQRGLSPKFFFDKLVDTSAFYSSYITFSFAGKEKFFLSIICRQIYCLMETRVDCFKIESQQYYLMWESLYQCVLFYLSQYACHLYHCVNVLVIVKA